MVIRVGINKLAKFGRFGRFLFPNQHVVIKVFSELRKENHLLEAGVFKFLDQKKCRENNINTAFITDGEVLTQQQPLIDFLTRIVSQSPNLPALGEAVSSYYSREPR
eukprot:sb/3477704/